ncbi:MAG: DUF1501 domain-containing protein, partial [Planctomycetes bacterium]|nr:DUF1501 domain-containing protein [Planctomycetota bacterium]
MNPQEMVSTFENKGQAMLSVFDGHRPVSRRQLMTIGGLGLGGLTLPSLLGAKAEAASTGRVLTGKSVIFLFQQGGPSQFETTDPKLDAPGGIRTTTGGIQTSVPGLTFGSTLEQMAKIADRLAVVRSFQTNNGGHNIQPIVGKHSYDANIGTHYARIAGATRADTGLPTNMILFPQAVDDQVTKGRARGKLDATGGYGSTYAPFTPGGGGQLQKNMTLTLPRERFFEDRRAVLSQLDRLGRRLESSSQFEALDEVQQQAFSILQSGGVADALDLSLEDQKTIERYDTSRFARSHNWERAARGKRGYYTGNAKTLGKLLLMARRLCEAGVGFITIHAGYDGVWDMHADGNNLNMTDGMEAVGRTYDHAVATFVQDLEERGLTDDILLVCCGEMGRTPRINKRGGRDHWSRLSPLVLHGGGIRPGVIGQSKR